MPDFALDDVLELFDDASPTTERSMPQKSRKSSVQSRAAAFAILRDAQSPLRAYEILDRMSARTGRRIAPPTVYRALEFLIGRHLVSRVEGQSAFVCVANEDIRQSHAFFICSVCGHSTQIRNFAIDRLLVDDAGAIGFEIGRTVIELRGTCAGCRAAPRPSA